MAAASNPGVVSRVRAWVLANFASSWFFLAPLLAAYVPRRLFQTYYNLFLRRRARRLLGAVDPYVSIEIAECPAPVRVHVYSPVAFTDTTFEEVKAYLSGACAREDDARELRAEGARHGDGLVISVRDGEDVADEFRGATFWWSSVVVVDGPAGGGGANQERRCQRLTFHRRHRRLVIDEYLPHVRSRGRDILFANRSRRLYTNNRTLDSYMSKPWSYVIFDHPTTFETLAMDPAKKRAIMDDLVAFRSSSDYYKRTGKPWKRGYLLYGPPGTGKSTMIAAMANHLKYDIYDVELTMVRNNNDLRKILTETTSKSIIVIEDIDCSLDLTGERAKQSTAPPPRNPYDPYASQVTLSGLLNFIDGLWSACGGERIVVFTTNHIYKLDPALTRSGRMDMHIEMSYCSFEAFRTLAKNHLDIDDHELFGAVQEHLREVDVTPADVAECLMKAKRAGNGDDASSMECFIGELKKKREEAKAAADAAAKAAEEQAEYGQEFEYTDELEEEDGQEIEYSDEVEEEEEKGQETEYSDEVKKDGQKTQDSDEVKEDGQKTDSDEVKEKDGQKTHDSEEVKEEEDKTPKT
ncbi:unnamed protein product [Urochloa decumbens]|uniref:AAA+ ATPase domain-containing protein n=1 Tax=Urochloa decumbens TaxID=240449 RepID=A0ABC9FND0_9POAL